MKKVLLIEGTVILHYKQLENMQKKKEKKLITRLFFPLSLVEKNAPPDCPPAVSLPISAVTV